MDFKKFLALPRQAVVIVLNYRNNEARISYSTCIGLTFGRLYQGLAGEEWELLLESSGADLETLMLHTDYYRNYYEKEGWTVYGLEGGPARRCLTYRLRLVPVDKFTSMGVEIVTARNKGKLIGKFKSSREAMDFIETYYATDNPHKLPVFAGNSDTKEFLTRRKEGIELR